MSSVWWFSSPTKGNEGGIMVMWNKDLVDCIDQSLSETFVSCLINSTTNDAEWFFLLCIVEVTMLSGQYFRKKFLLVLTNEVIRVL